MIFFNFFFDVNTIIIGVDPGMEGCWAAIDGNSNLVSRIVNPRIGGKGPVDLPVIINWMKSICIEGYDRCIFAFEDVHPLYGVSVSSTGSLMESKGMIRGVLTVFAMSHTNASVIPLTPKKWQSTVWLTGDKVTKASKLDTKATSLVAAKRIWPNDRFLASSRCKTPHDGIVDAMLIAEAARRLHNV